MNDTLVLGAVAYDPKVVTIWEGFKEYFAKRGLAFDYVLYSNYESQVEAMLRGDCAIAWNSPLAWIRARRMAQSRGLTLRALAMRDTDCDLSSVIIVRKDSAIGSVGDLAGMTVGVGAIDSPQATLIPLQFLSAKGLEPGLDYKVRRFDVLAGKHGDHIGGERDAARALEKGEVAAACMIDGNHLLFIREGTLSAGQTKVLAQTDRYDHCNFTVAPGVDEGQVCRFLELLLAMSYADPEVRPLLDLEGLKMWKKGRVEGYVMLEAAVDHFNFYDVAGNVTSPDYRY